MKTSAERDATFRESHSTPRLRYDRNFILRVTARIVLSGALGCAATEGLYLIDKFGPYSSIRDRVTEILTFPGLIIARLFYLVGRHIGSGSSELWWAFFFGKACRVIRRGRVGVENGELKVTLFSMLSSATLFWTSCTFLQKFVTATMIEQSYVLRKTTTGGIAPIWRLPPAGALRGAIQERVYASRYRFRNFGRLRVFVSLS